MMRPSNPQILIVDDNTSIRKCLSDLFILAGLDGWLARDRFSALSEIRLQVAGYYSAFRPQYPVLSLPGCAHNHCRLPAPLLL